MTEITFPNKKFLLTRNHYVKSRRKTLRSYQDLDDSEDDFELNVAPGAVIQASTQPPLRIRSSDMDVAIEVETSTSTNQILRGSKRRHLPPLDVLWSNSYGSYTASSTNRNFSNAQIQQSSGKSASVLQSMRKKKSAPIDTSSFEVRLLLDDVLLTEKSKTLYLQLSAL